MSGDVPTEEWVMTAHQQEIEKKQGDALGASVLKIINFCQSELLAEDKLGSKWTVVALLLAAADIAAGVAVGAGVSREEAVKLSAAFSQDMGKRIGVSYDKMKDAEAEMVPGFSFH